MMVRAAPTFLGSNSRCLHFLLLWACICPLAAAAESTAGGAGAQNSHGPGSAARVLAHTQLHAPQISSQLQGQQQQHPQMAAVAGNMAASLLLPRRQRHQRKRPQLPGSSYEYLLSRHQRQRGVAHLGTTERLRRAMAGVLAGQRLVVGVVGGSISCGHGAVDAPGWVQRVEKFLQDAYGKDSPLRGDVRLHNAALPGTTSTYFASCMRLHVPQDANIVLVDFAVNDLPRFSPAFNNPDRRAFERLIRKLLLLPQRPAVVLVNAYNYFFDNPRQGAYWSNVETDFTTFAQYYNLVSLSVRGCCYDAMVANTTGFQVHAVRRQDSVGLKGKVFYYDDRHPDGQTGHRAIADLVVHLLQRTTRRLLNTPLRFLNRAAVETAAAADVPRPMMPNNHASAENTCFIGPEFKAKSVVSATGWEWINESKTARPKWGYVSKQPGSKLVFQVDARASSGNTSAPVLVQVGHLSSYQHMGKALLRCESGCTCKPSVINGHWNQRVSLLSLPATTVTPSPRCFMSVTVTPQTASGEHKVKIMAVMVSEEGGDAVGFETGLSRAVEYVHDISLRQTGAGNSTLYDVRNNVK